MTSLRLILIPFVYTLLVPVFAMAESPGICEVELLPVEVNWRTFAPEGRFEQPHYIVPSIPDFVTLEDASLYASNAVKLAVWLAGTQGGKGREPYIDNYVRDLLSVALSLLVAYEWNTGYSMREFVDSLTDLAYGWLPADPHKRIGDAAPFYERFDSEYHKRAVLEVDKLCQEAAASGDTDGIFCALETAVSTAVVAVTGSEETANVFVERLSSYMVPCNADGVCPAGALPFFAGQNASNMTYPNGVLSQVADALTYEEASSNPRLLPLSREQVERGLAYYHKRLHDGALDFEARSLGGRIADLVTSPAHLKKLSSTTSNTGKFIAGYSLYCKAPTEVDPSADPSKWVPPIAAFPGGSKVSSVMGLTLVNRLTAAVSAGMKFWESYDEWIDAIQDQEVAARFEKDSQAFDLTLASLAEEMEVLKNRIAAKASTGNHNDSMALINEFESAYRSYSYLMEQKEAAEQHALAALAGLQAADERLDDAQWRGLSMSAVGGLDSVVRLLSAVTKLSLQVAAGSGLIVEASVRAGKTLPDALEKLSPGLATVLITTNIALGIGEAYDMYNVQAAADSVLSLPGVELDPELRAALTAAHNQDWSAWGASLIFDVLKDARNIIAAMVSWGVVEFFAQNLNGKNLPLIGNVRLDPKVSVAKSIISIWSLTLINAVIPTYWKWTEETEDEAEKVYQQALLDGIRDGLEGGGESPKYKEMYGKSLYAIAQTGKIAERALVNTMVLSQLFHELIAHDTRYAAFIMLDRYRDGDSTVADFFEALGLTDEQLSSLSLAPSELRSAFAGEENMLRDSLKGIEGRSINFVEGHL